MVDNMVDKIVPSYLYKKRGVWYFTKHVPYDVKEHHGVSRIIKSLRTKNLSHAKRLSIMYQEKLEGFWLSMRMQHMEFLLKPRPHATNATHTNTPTIKETEAIYIHLKEDGKSKTFYRAAERNVGYVINELGNRPIADYSSADAASFRDTLFDRGLSSASVTRIFSSLRAIKILPSKNTAWISRTVLQPPTSLKK